MMAMAARARSDHDMSVPDVSFRHFSIGSNPVPLISQPGSVTLSVGYGPGHHVLDLTQKLSDFRAEGHLCDVTLRIDGGCDLPAHRLLLAAGSPYFNALFSSSFADSSSRVHELTWMSRDTAEAVLSYIYSGKVSLDYHTIANILAAAEFLILPNLKKHCVAFMKNILGTKNVCRIQYLTQLYQLDELTTPVNDILNNSSCSDIFDDSQLVQLPSAFIYHLILDQRFKHLREVDLVEFVIKWVEHDQDNRQEHMPKLMNCVLFQCLPSWYIDKLRENPLTRDLVESSMPTSRPSLVSDDLGSRRDDSEIAALDTTSLDARTTHAPGGCQNNDDEDIVMVVTTGMNSPCLGYIPKQDHWVEFSVLPRNMDMRRKGIKPVCIGKKLYMLVTMEESMAWLPSSINSGFSAVQFWCLDVESNQWSELAKPHSPSKCFHLLTCGQHIFALGISGTLERYDQDDGEWFPCTPPSRTVAFFDTLQFSDDKLLYVLNVYSTSYPSGGGNCLQMYDPDTDSWQTVGLKNQENDLVVLTYRLPGRKTTVSKQNGLLQLYNTLGQHWADIDLKREEIKCWKWKTILPNKIYAGHGWTITIPDLDSLFILNSSNNQCAMFDFDTGTIAPNLEINE